MTLIGTSLGGLVASRFAEIFPDLVDSLVLIAAAGLSVQAPVITNFAHLPVRITHDLRACVSQGVAPYDSIPQVIGEALFSGLGGRIVLGQFTGGWVRFLVCVCVCVCVRARARVYAGRGHRSVDAAMSQESPSGKKFDAARALLQEHLDENPVLLRCVVRGWSGFANVSHTHPGVHSACVLRCGQVAVVHPSESAYGFVREHVSDDRSTPTACAACVGHARYHLPVRIGRPSHCMRLDAD